MDWRWQLALVATLSIINFAILMYQIWTEGGDPTYAHPMDDPAYWSPQNQRILGLESDVDRLQRQRLSDNPFGP